MTAAIKAPINGPITGIHEQLQSFDALFFIGKIECIILGPKSLAGFMAYPVVPPKDRPIDQTKKATGTAPIDPRPIISCVSFIVAFEKFKMVKIKTKVPIISLIKL